MRKCGEVLRTALCALIVTQILPAQQQPETIIRTNVPLVVLPATVTDRLGNYLTGLKASDFIVLDDGKPRPVHVDDADLDIRPLALVVVIQTNDISRSALAKIVKTGTLIADGVMGANGEVAIVGFDDGVTLLQDFTNDSGRISSAFHKIAGAPKRRARMIDGVNKGLDLIATRPAPRRAALLVIGESRDRGSKGNLDDLLRRIQSTDVTVYGLTYSAFLTPFTVKSSEYKPPDTSCELPLFLVGLCYAGEAARLAKANTVEALVVGTGGRHLAFETLAKLEADLLGLSEDIHSRYTLSFSPDAAQPPGFHRVDVKVKDRPDAVVRARQSYWLAAQDLNPRR
jgi:VWFA-related protein